MILSGEFVISLVLSHRDKKFEATNRPVSQTSDRPVLQLRVIVQFYLENKGKYILEA